MRTSLVGAARRHIAAAVVLAWVRMGATAGIILWALRALDHRTVFTGQEIWLGVALAAIRAVASAAAPRIAAAASARVESDLRERIYSKVLSLGPSIRRSSSTGELVSRATEGVEAVGSYAGTFLPMLFGGITIPILLVVGVALIDPVTGLVLAVVLPLIPGLLRFLEKRFQSVSARYQENAELLSARFLDALQGLTTLKAFGRSTQHTEELARESERLRSSVMRLLFVNQLALLAVDALFSLGTVVLATWVLVARIDSGAIGETSGALVAGVLLAALLIEAMGQIGRFFYVGAIGRASATVVREFLELPEPEIPESSVDAVSDGSIEFRGVRFAHPDGAAVFEGFDLRVEPSEHVAIVGPSGAGKTTLTQLLMGFVTPDDGAVLVGGQDLRHTGPAWAHRMIAFVPQDPYLFTGTVADNLRFAKPEATDEELKSAAEAAHLQEVIDRLPSGWDTKIGERGMALSAGEAQRLAIARALLRDSPIVVLDEPTSNVDLASERAIAEGLSRLTAGRTVVVIAHRFSTVVDADRVVVLRDGAITEEGSPERLASGEGLFARMAARGTS